MIAPYYSMTTLFPPTVIDMPDSGKRFAISGSTWIEVTPDVTQKMVQDCWTPTRPTPVYRYEVEEKTFKAKSSRTGEEYVVTQKGTVWSCNCMGFEYRKKCKHVDQFKTK